MYFNSTNVSEDINMSTSIDNTSMPFLLYKSDVVILQILKNVEKTAICSFIPPTFAVGAPANILSMIVFCRQGLRDRMNLCLFCLAFVDLMFGASMFLRSSSCIIGIFLPDQEQFWSVILVARTLNFQYGSAYTSGCLTMIIAVERCVCVMFPMKAATLISTKTMAIIVSGTFLTVHALCAVYLVKEEIISVTDESGKSITILTNTKLYRSYGVFKVIEDVVLSAISFSSFAIVVLATALTVIRLNDAMTWRKSAANSYLKSQAVLIRMLVAVSCVYILCTSPTVALALTRFTVPEFRSDGGYGNVFHGAHTVSSALVMFNSSINFFVYLAMSSRFRHELRTLCPGCDKPRLLSKPSL